LIPPNNGIKITQPPRSANIYDEAIVTHGSLNLQAEIKNIYRVLVIEYFERSFDTLLRNYSATARNSLSRRNAMKAGYRDNHLMTLKSK
jgi:hypothetical protein